LGPITAERTFTLFRADGTALPITVRLGKPFQEPTSGDNRGDYCCPVQIVGADERVYAPWGEDPFVALQYAIDLAGQLSMTWCSGKVLRFGSSRVILIEQAGFGGTHISPTV